ncbi:MAG: dinitrogenase iron-molybdenum cofactor biosynthesis protein [Deltaproteobacteria bacterium]|nr:dinitrogenase iron-molybdenum cofactor biosynthesis protein [Deltaproteobacteria bacterium]
MKIAVTSQGTTLESEMDPRFGRAAYIMIVDSETMAFEVFDNSENANALKGAGIKTSVLISENGAKVLLTGYCGPNAFKTLHTGGLKVVNDVNGSVKEAVLAFNDGIFTYSEGPNKDGHW